MNIIVILILILAAGAIIVGGLHFFASTKGEEAPIVTQPTCATCNGEDSRCEQESMMEAATKDREYDDDEELDRFRGRPSDGYTDEEADEFREILYTMKPEEAQGWNRSLILRQINVPNQVKDELVILLDERGEK